MNNTNQKRYHHRRKRSAISVKKRVLHYQVYAEFFLTNGKPSLVKLELCSIRAACTAFFVMPLKLSVLKFSRIFPTQKIAYSYISYLQALYKSTAPLPVLDSNQNELFQGGSILKH